MGTGLIRSFGAMVCLAMCLWIGAAQAQTPATASGSEAPVDQEVIQPLIDVLNDDAAREALIADLEARAGAAPADPATSEESETLAQSLAQASAEGANDAFRAMSRAWRDLMGIGVVMKELPEDRRARIDAGFMPLIATVFASFIALFVMQRVFVKLFHVNRVARAHDHSFRVVALRAVSDMAALWSAYFASYALAYWVFGQTGQLLTEQALYLNGFLVAGFVQIVLGMFVRPVHSNQSFLRLAPEIQRMIYTRGTVLNFLLVFGIAVTVPIANMWVSLALGRSVRVIVLTVAALLALASIWKLAGLFRAAAEQRGTLSDADADADTLTDRSMQAAHVLWNQIWPWLASAYVVTSYIVALTRPRLMVDVIGEATLKTGAAILCLTFAYRLMRRANEAEIHMPRSLHESVPELKQRFDELATPVTYVLASGLLLIGGFLLIDAWVVDLWSWLSGSTGSRLLWRVVSALLVILSFVLIWVFISAWIDRRLRLNIEGRHSNARRRTLLSLFRNAFAVFVVVCATMIALSQLGIDIAPLLAGAGVVGLAIGFGSQKLVQDIINGIFIQLENAMNEGDYVTVAGIEGTVEKLTIKSVALRDTSGTYHIIPFSSVDRVSNFNRNFAYHLEEVGVSYNADLDAVKAAMYVAFERLRESDVGGFVIGEMDMQGVTALAASSVNVRARIMTAPGYQWMVGRAYTELVKRVFDEQGIEIPYPHMQVIEKKE